VWLIQAGRGFGKTRTGAEWVRALAESATIGRIHLVARTAADVRDTMVEGESGILACSPPWFRPKYFPSKRKLVWPNGTQALCFSADKPDALRGPQCAAAWCDETASWPYLTDALDNLMLGLRLGDNPRVLHTTTPRPKKIFRELARDPTCVVTRGSTYDNLGNLPEGFRRDILKKYEGTAKGRQELHGDLLEEAQGAVWRRAWIESGRRGEAPDLIKIVVGVDPAMTARGESNETGIVVDGWCEDDHLYVLDDCSGRYSADGWARRACNAYKAWEADGIIAEVNQGGDLVETNIRTVDQDAAIPYRAVHASRGKRTRAEPVASLYEQGRAHHIGQFTELEDQMCNWEPGDISPDRMDAHVWAATDLMGGHSTLAEISDLDRPYQWNV
jgi:phage terminase large subunit-like protein